MPKGSWKIIMGLLVGAAVLGWSPLTAGAEDGRPDGATAGSPVTEAPDAGGSGELGGSIEWDGDGPAPRTLVHSGDSTIQGSLCVGFDCASNEPMGFATIKLEENNLRIAAADSSVVSGFPTTDWQIEFNSSSSGGGSYFMVRDCGTGGAAGSVDSTCGGTPMLTIEGGADNESIHVDSSGNQGGNVGLGTATPVVDLHILSGNTPTMRLEQDNASGFTPQSWDVAGNESNFFIRDVTNGSSLPIRIEPGVASNTLYLDNNELIGLGTSAPQERLDIANGTTNQTNIAIEEPDSGSPVDRWLLGVRGNDNGFQLTRSGSGSVEFQIDEAGNATFSGTVTATVGGTNHDLVGEITALQGEVDGLRAANVALRADNEAMRAQLSELQKLVDAILAAQN